VKITPAKVLVCCPGRKFLTLKIYNDEGVFGLGDATLIGRELPVGSFLTHVIPCLIGRDPFQTEDLWQYFYRGAYWRGGPVTMTAIGAVDMALWDTEGKALNMPVYNLLELRAELGCWPTGTPMDATSRRLPTRWPSTRSWAIWLYGRRPACGERAAAGECLVE
jgi:mannonate dehydratase